MSTTALVIEHLIIGLQAAIWLSLMVFIFFGWSWVDITIVKDLSSLIAFLGLATVYPIGLFVDELADFIFKPWAKRIRDSGIREEGGDPDRMEMTAHYILQNSSNQYLKNSFSYIRMRIRVSRSTAINLALITIFSLIFTTVRLDHIQGFGLIILSEILLGFLSIILSVWVWVQVSKTFAKKIAQTSKSLPATSSH